MRENKANDKIMIEDKSVHIFRVVKNIPDVGFDKMKMNRAAKLPRSIPLKSINYRIPLMKNKQSQNCEGEAVVQSHIPVTEPGGEVVQVMSGGKLNPRRPKLYFKRAEVYEQPIVVEYVKQNENLHDIVIKDVSVIKDTSIQTTTPSGRKTHHRQPRK